MSDPLFLHCHIFKNAGTSLIESFRRAFPDKAIELEPTDPDGFLSEDQIIEALAKNPELVFISSHRLKLPLPLFINNRKIIPIIFFRDPIERLGSVYRFERKDNRPTVYSALAKISSVSEFFDTVLDAGFEVIISNVHSDFCSVGSKYSLDDVKVYIENNALIGLVEDYYFSMAMIEKEVKKYFPDKNLIGFEENVTRNNREIAKNCTKTIDELGVYLSKKIIMKNYKDYKLYNIVCDILYEAWCDEENKISYFNYCQRHKIDNKYADKRIKCAPSLECIENIENIENFSKKEDCLSNPNWVRLNHLNQFNTKKPVIEAMKIECADNHIGKCFKSGQILGFDFKVRWPISINQPVVGIVIKNHRNVVVCSINNLSFGLENECVTAGALLIYRFTLTLPEIVSGLYKVDVQLGFGLGMQHKVTSIAEAAIAFGVKTSVSAGADFIPIEDAKSRIKYYPLG